MIFISWYYLPCFCACVKLDPHPFLIFILQSVQSASAEPAELNVFCLHFVLAAVNFAYFVWIQLIFRYNDVITF